MPIITWDDGDILRGKTLDAGPYEAVLAEVDGPRQSNSGKGMNLFLTFRISKGDFAGKEIKYALTSASSNASLLGDLMWAPMGDMYKIVAAINGIHPGQVQKGGTQRVDTDDIKDRPLTLVVGVQIVDGVPVNTINAFLPAEAAHAAPGF
jgi:hypothetical protein